MEVRHNDSGTVIITLPKEERSIFAQALGHAARTLVKTVPEKEKASDDDRVGVRQAAALIHQLQVAVKPEHQIKLRATSGARDVAFIQMLEADIAAARNPIVYEDDDDDDDPVATLKAATLPDKKKPR